MPSQGREMGDICSSRLKLVCLHLKVGFIVGWLVGCFLPQLSSAPS